jgi:beta-glucuronidase
MVREAERLGLMVWEEIPVYWTVAWEDADAQALAQAQLQALIRRDRNRGAVILWSIGNETPPGEARLRFMAGLAATARALDPSRLVTVALEQHGGERRVVEDPLGAHLDVLGLNEYIGWYDGPPERCRRTTFECAWDKPLIVSELGADAKAGLHGGEAERWTEEYQAWVYREQLAMLGRVPNLRGMAPWILKDFRSPRRPLPGIQDGWNRKGLLSELGAKKLAWGVLQAHYRGLAGA